ncbi:MAG: PIG-L family deacetylase [SAR202 cluster bacterium]|jgi:LmbE family N-acetylglucosaminyl deacetylase|nr:PIG-L family deacetylase [SAR202 cluster bacterium]|tara:strand:+ start:36425 stop:37150 length:726 start_codon:yes stop_codon:yes gene_type:complete
MPPLDDSEIERVLVVTAHPDDLDFGAAGTIAQWTAKGIEVSYCICTNGDQGGEDPSVPRADMPKIRKREQIEAGKVLGVTNIEFLNHRDGWLTPTIELRKQIVREIRKTKPQRMLIQSPERNWDRLFSSHPDHMAAGEAAIQAVYPDARNAFAFEELLKDEGLEPWRVREVWVMSHNTPDHFIDITETFDKKLAALNAHISQTAHNPNLEQMIREFGERNAKLNGLADGAVAEIFKIVSSD